MSPCRLTSASRFAKPPVSQRGTFADKQLETQQVPFRSEPIQMTENPYAAPSGGTAREPVDHVRWERFLVGGLVSSTIGLVYLALSLPRWNAALLRAAISADLAFGLQAVGALATVGGIVTLGVAGAARGISLLVRVVRTQKSCHVGIEKLYLGAHPRSQPPAAVFEKRLELTRQDFNERSLSVEQAPAGCSRQLGQYGLFPSCLIRRSAPTERHTFLRPWHTPRVAPRRGTGHGVNGVIGCSCRTWSRQGLEPPLRILIQ